MNAKKTMILASLLLSLAGPFATVAAAQDPAPAQPPTQAQPAQPPATVAPAPANPSVNVTVTRTEDTGYMNPMLIGLGVLVLIVLVVLASRAGEPTSSTTIIKD